MLFLIEAEILWIYITHAPYNKPTHTIFLTHAKILWTHATREPTQPHYPRHDAI